MTCPSKPLMSNSGESNEISTTRGIQTLFLVIALVYSHLLSVVCPQLNYPQLYDLSANESTSGTMEVSQISGTSSTYSTLKVILAGVLFCSICLSVCNNSWTVLIVCAPHFLRYLRLTLLHQNLRIQEFVFETKMQRIFIRIVAYQGRVDT